MNNMESVDSVHDAHDSTMLADSIANAFEQTEFRANVKSILIKSNPTWYNVSDCSSRQNRLIHKLQTTEAQFKLLIDGADERTKRTEWRRFNSIRVTIKAVLKDLLRTEMKFCRQHSVEQHFWKTLYYNLIEVARSTSRHCSNTEQIRVYRQLCIHLIDDGVAFFEQVLAALSDAYGFRLEQFSGAESGRNLKGLKFVSLAIVSAQKCCLYLGDLFRYRELVRETNDFTGAAKWYTKAYQLIPTNGMPSNQLAIIALYNKKKFNAIFHHMQSLNASNPIKSAKESLVILFDELRKKFETESLLRANKQQKQQQQHQYKSEKKFQREIWVHPTDGQLNYRTVYLDQDDCEPIDSIDMYKKFILDFSHYHGIQFTKVGSDSLHTCIDSCLKHFQELLNTTDLLSLVKLIQIIILNIYSITAATKSSSSPASDALAFAFALIGIVMKRLVNALNAFKLRTNANAKRNCSQTPNQFTIDRPIVINQINEFNLSADIGITLAAVSLWCNWMRANWSIWSTPVALSYIHKFSEPYDIRLWDLFASLTMALDRYTFHIHEHQMQIHRDAVDNMQAFKRIRLAEDMIALDMPSVIRDDFVYLDGECRTSNASNILRWTNIQRFCDNELMSVDSPFLCRLDFGDVVVSMHCESVTADSSTTDFDLSSDELNTTGESSSMKSEDMQNSLDAVHPFNTGSSESNRESITEIQLLLQRKIELEQTQKMQEKLSQFAKDIVHQTSAPVKRCFEIRPKFLLPDTNCFIDYLPQIKQLAQAYPLYKVIVPIVVLNELEGLAKGDESCVKIYYTSTETTLNAHGALEFLKSNGSMVKCATTKGSLLNSMAFTKESDYATTSTNSIGTFTNDDKILLTAINMTKLHSNDAMANAKLLSAANVERKVVLLTNDRNLRLKAISQNIPVRELIDFIKWSGIAQ